jgi:hypothetical protein
VGMYSWVIRTFESKMKVMSVSTIYSYMGGNSGVCPRILHHR